MTPHRRARHAAWIAVAAMLIALVPTAPAAAAPMPDTITGRVFLGTTAQPAGAGDVVVTLERFDGDTPVPYPGVSATTDASGYYTFTGLGNDRFNVVFDYVGTGSYVAHSTPYTAFFAGTNYDFTVPQGFVIAGRVSLESPGVYASAGEVRVTASYAGRTVTALTDADGRYDLGRLPVAQPGWTLSFTYLGPDNYPAWYYTADKRGSSSGPSYVLNNADEYGYDTVIGAGVAFSGTLRTTSGDPVAGHPVRIVGFTPSNSYTSFTTTTRADGSYHIRALPNDLRYFVAWGQSEDDDYAAGTAPNGNVYRSGTLYVPTRDQHYTGVDGTAALASVVSVDLSWPASLDAAIDDGPGQAQVFMQWLDPISHAWTEPSVIGVFDSENPTIWSPYELPSGRYRLWAAYMFGEAPFEPTWVPEFQLDEGEWFPIQLALAATPVAEKIGRLYTQLGGASSWLGTQLSGLVPIADGTSVRYQYGWITSHPKHGTWAIFDGGSGKVWGAAGGELGALGWPTGPQACSSGRCWQPFVGGIVTSTPFYGAHAIWGGFVLEWLAAGGLDGRYGAAVNDLGYVSGSRGAGWQQNFQSGVLTQSSTGFHLVSYPIAMGWLSRGGGGGWLGWPTGESQGTTWAWQSFDGGIVHANPVGTETVSGGFVSEWLARGAMDGELGVAWTPLKYATSPRVFWRQTFAGGTLVQSSSGFHVVASGPINVEWAWLDALRWIGAPTEERRCTALGCSQQFDAALMTENSSVAFPVVGGLASYWLEHDGGSTIGPALNLMRFNPVNGGGWAQHFTTGVLTQSAASGGGVVFTPYGPILNTWYQYGAEATWLGWPTGAQTCTAGGCVQRFQHGVARSTAGGAVSFSAS